MALAANFLSGLASCKRDAKSWIKVNPLSGDERSETKTNIHIRVSQLAEPRLKNFLLVSLLAPRIFVLQYSILCNSPSYKKYVSMVLRIPTNAKLVFHQSVKHAKIRNFNIQYILYICTAKISLIMTVLFREAIPLRFYVLQLNSFVFYCSRLIKRKTDNKIWKALNNCQLPKKMGRVGRFN